MLELTAAETAGTFVGAWGTAYTLARVIAVVASGGIFLDMGHSLLHVPVLAYGLVFGLQALGMVLAILFLGRVDVAKCRIQAQQAVASVLPD